MKILALLTLASLAGCTNGEFTPTAESKAAVVAAVQRKAATRQYLFERCMSMAANVTHISSDVAEIVKACDNQSWYSVQRMQ